VFTIQGDAYLRLGPMTAPFVRFTRDGAIAEARPTALAPEIEAIVAASRAPVDPGADPNFWPLAALSEALGCVPQDLFIEFEHSAHADFLEDARHLLGEFQRASNEVEVLGGQVRDYIAEIPEERRGDAAVNMPQAAEIVRLGKVQRRAAFSCLSCLYAAEETAFFALATKVFGSEEEARSLSFSRINEKWKALFKAVPGARPFGKRGLGLGEHEAMAVHALNYRGDMTHLKVVYEGVGLFDRVYDGGLSLPKADELAQWVDAIETTLADYHAEAGFPLTSSLQALR